MRLRSIMFGILGLVFAWTLAHAAETPASVKIRGIVKTETDQAAPNGFTVRARTKGVEVSGTASPNRSTGEFTLTVSGLSAGQEVGILVEDPMAKPVPMRAGQAASFKLDQAALSAGVLDVGVVRVELPPQEAVEAFAFGGRVYDSGGKPLAPGYVMHVTTERGDRKTSEEIEGGKFALIFIDLQGEFPRIKEGDRFRFAVRDKSGKEFSVEPSGYGLTRTDIANSSISTLEFKVKL